MSAPRALLTSRALRACAIAAVSGTLFVGVLHTQAARPLLALLRSVPGCPLMQAADPTLVEHARAAAARKRGGSAVERSRAALGFELGSTRRTQVLAYLSRHGIACEAERADSVLRCKHAPSELSPAGAPPIDDLHLQFDPQERLVAIDLWRAGTSSCTALSWLASLERKLGERVGPATAHRGEADAAWLEAGKLRRTALEYHYRGYLAELSATRFGSRGVRVRERYQWIPARAGDGA